MTDETTTIDPNAGTSSDALTPDPNGQQNGGPVTIAGTATTPTITISADEHQLIADLKASGHDLSVLFKDIIAKGEEAI